MLKWAVNEPRKSYLPPMEEQNDCMCCCADQQDIIINSCYSRRSLNMIGTEVFTTTTTMSADRRILRRKSFDIRALRHDIERLVTTNRAIYRARQSVTYISESTLI